MNDIQAFIDRQLGICCRYNYDSVIRRLVVNSDESFYGLQNRSVIAHLDHDPPIFACRFAEVSGYEHILALANEDGRVALQNVNKKSNDYTFEGFRCHNNAVFDLAWRPGSMNFVTVSGDHTASLWDAQDSTPKRILLFSSHTRSVKTATFRPDDPSVFATGARDGNIFVWDIRARVRPALVLKPDNGMMNCHSCFTPKTPGSHSKRPRDARATSITGLAFQDDYTLISCGECDGNIKVWDLRKNYSIYKREPLPKHSIPYCGSSTKNGYTNLIIDDARTRLYASCMDDVIYCFNVSTYSALPEQRYIGHENSTFYIKTCLSPDCRYLVSGSSDKNAYVWNVKRSEPVVKLVGHWAEVTCAAWAQRALVTCSDDARHKLWRLGREHYSEHEARELQGRAEAAPRAPAAARQWTPCARRPEAAPGAKRPRLERLERRSKRCLADMLNASRDADAEPRKRARAGSREDAESDENVAPCEAGTKRPADDSALENPSKRLCGDCDENLELAVNWNDSSSAGHSFTTPTKNLIEETSTADLSSPPQVRLMTFTTPTKNLPNFVLNGEAPHLRLMSPLKKKQEHTNWLAQIVLEKRTRQTDDGARPMGPASPKDGCSRKNILGDRTPKSNNKNATLLKYFNITNKNN